MSDIGAPDSVFEAFIEQLERYVRDRLVPAENETIELNRVPDDIRKEMAEMGLFGITFPEQYGGGGFNHSQYVKFVEVLSWALPAFRSILSINAGMTGSAIVNYGTDAQKREWLPRLASGEVACFGLTEPVRARMQRRSQHVRSGTAMITFSMA